MRLSKIKYKSNIDKKTGFCESNPVFYINNKLTILFIK